MTKLISKLLIVLSLSLWAAACYTDDSSQVNPDRLPFEDFAEFFLDNNSQADTLTLNISQQNTLNTVGGITLTIPQNAFGSADNISLEIKEANTKSDFIFLDKPTVDGTDWVEGSELILLQPFDASGPLNIDAPVNIKMANPNQINIDELVYYNFQNSWTPDSNIDIYDNATGLSFESTSTQWQMAGRVFDNTNSAQLSVKPFGYGTIPHDMRVFIMFKDQQIILPMDHDVATVTATGMVPTDTDIHVIAMVMDHFKLSVGISTIRIDQDEDLDLQMNIVTVADMMASIKALD